MCLACLCPIPDVLSNLISARAPDAPICSPFQTVMSTHEGALALSRCTHSRKTPRFVIRLVLAKYDAYLRAHVLAPVSTVCRTAAPRLTGKKNGGFYPATFVNFRAAKRRPVVQSSGGIQSPQTRRSSAVTVLRTSRRLSSSLTGNP